MRTFIPMLSLFVLFACKPDTQEPVPVPPAAPQTQPTATSSAPTNTTLSIERIHAEKGALAGQSVRVQGRVVTMNKAIMNRNWIHLQDGTGNAADGTHDLTLTTKDDAKVGDEIVVTGTVVLDRKFGAGYDYAVLLENASIAGAPPQNKQPAVHGSPKSASLPTRAGLPLNHPPIQKPPAKPAPANATSKTLHGAVLEVVYAGTRYTYLRLQDGEAMAWVAVPYTQFKVGQTVSIRGQMFQKNYFSKSLKRGFESIWFGTLESSPTPTSEPKTDSTKP